MVEYFKRATHVDEVIKPFLATKTACAFDVRATVAGGGLSGQADEHSSAMLSDVRELIILASRSLERVPGKIMRELVARTMLGR